MQDIYGDAHIKQLSMRLFKLIHKGSPGVFYPHCDSIYVSVNEWNYSLLFCLSFYKETNSETFMSDKTWQFPLNSNHYLWQLEQFSEWEPLCWPHRQVDAG